MSVAVHVVLDSGRWFRPMTVAVLAAACSLLVVPGVVVAEPFEDDDESDRRHSRRHPRERRESFDPSLPVPQLEVRGSLHGGDRVWIRWRAEPGIEECELLLSIDGGRHFDLRVSPELEGHETGYVWQVPNLNARDARLRLRARVDGMEVEGPVSEAVTLVWNRGQPADAWLFREGGGELEVSIGSAAALEGRESPELREMDASAASDLASRMARLAPEVRTLPRRSQAAHIAPPLDLRGEPTSSRFAPLRE